MIKAYTGVPGSGKSLHATRLICAYLKAGKYVIANFPFKIDLLDEDDYTGRFFFIPNHLLTVDILYQFHAMYLEDGIENQCLLMIDEAHEKFNCRTYNQPDRLGFNSYFTHHRKSGYSIVLITQNLRQIDRQIRDLIEIEVLHRKLNNYSIWSILPFPLFIAIERNLTISGKKQQKNNSEFFLYSKKYGALYDTFFDFSRKEKFEPTPILNQQVLEAEIKRTPDIIEEIALKRRRPSPPPSDGVAQPGP